MKLWLLTPTDEGAAEWHTWHNCMFGFVVRAANESAARIEASKQAGDEGPGAWAQRNLSRCEELTGSGAAGVILSAYNRAQ
jgi:hypothetical protein